MRRRLALFPDPLRSDGPDVRADFPFRAVFLLVLSCFRSASLLLLPFTAVADPADPSPFTRTQPDGSSITLTLHGDEYYSYLTDSDGHVVELGEDGYYHIARSIRPSAFARMQREQQEGEYANRRRLQVGTGDRSERIRTYNFPQGRVTDHRIGLTLYKIDEIMEGHLDEIIDALTLAEQTALLNESR